MPHKARSKPAEASASYRPLCVLCGLSEATATLQLSTAVRLSACSGCYRENTGRGRGLSAAGETFTTQALEAQDARQRERAYWRMIDGERFRNHLLPFSAFPKSRRALLPGRTIFRSAAEALRYLRRQG